MDPDAPAEMDPDLEQLAKNLEWRFRRHPNEQVTTAEVQKLTPETAGLSKTQVRDIMGFYVKKYKDVRLAPRVSGHGGNKAAPNMTLVGMAVLQYKELLNLVKIIIVNGLLFEDVAEVYALKCPARLSVLGSAMASATVGFLEKTFVLIIR